MVLKCPFFTFNSTINKFIKKHEKWIEEKLKKSKKVELSPEKIKLYKKQAHDYIPDRVAYFAQKFGFIYNKIRITSASTRWGSCSSSKNLNFSFRLIRTPESVIDYVIIHELAHLKHMNHSKNFWKEVETMYPNYKESEKWLKQN